MGEVKETCITPLAVAMRGEQGSIVLFSCKVAAGVEENVHFWATCGQRKRFPVSVEIRRDEIVDGSRSVICAVHLPYQYSACTLHMWLISGGRPLFESCRVSEQAFFELAPITKTAQSDRRYHEWFLDHRADEAELDRERNAIKSFALNPLVSVITPVYRTPQAFLSKLIESVLAQSYGNLELILVNVSGECPEVDEVIERYNDRRLTVLAAPNRTIPENTNVGIAAARGDYIAFVDHDDYIEPDTLFRYVEVLNKHPQCDLLFCDEDLWDEGAGGGRFTGARFKPRWNPDLLCTHDYVCHMLMVSRWAIDRTERSGSDVNGAQDYDLTFKVAEVARDIQHVPAVLYHWRTHSGSTSSNRDSKPYALEAGRKAVQGHFDRRGSCAQVEYGTAPFSYCVKYVPFRASDISLVLWSKEFAAPAERMEAINVLGGEVELIACGQEHLNGAVAMARGEVVVLLEESVEVDTDSWLLDVTRNLRCTEIGCCAPALANRGSLVLSAGLALGHDGSWHHRHAGFPVDDFGYMEMLDHVHDVSAVAPYCMAIRKQAFIEAGQFDQSLDDAWMAIDFCTRLQAKGYRVAVIPQAVLCIPGIQALNEIEGGAAPCKDELSSFVQTDPYGDKRLNHVGTSFGILMDQDR